ncbi:MAG TPA: hypothetical protein VL949_07390 [Geobacteraceae bacterium]|nr:hypothetical protein [Geobacteraceae bacterium]
MVPDNADPFIREVSVACCERKISRAVGETRALASPSSESPQAVHDALRLRADRGT